MISFSETNGRIKIELFCIPMGEDLCIVICGGEIPHLGAMAVAQVRPSLSDPRRLSSSTSVITLLGHKEDVLAKEVADKVCTQLNKNVITCCGIHLKNATCDEIKLVTDMVEKLTQYLIARLK